jgi:23S rRNA (uridine2552-2'-O)-methyltransferase
LIGVDLVDMDELKDCEFIKGDIKEMDILKKVKSVLGDDGLDLILSDMAPGFSGIKSIDVPRVNSLVEFALKVSKLEGMLKSGGNLCCKYLHGEGEQELRNLLKSHFKTISVLKPK